MGIRLLADKPEAIASHGVWGQRVNGELMVQAPRKAPAPQRGAAALATASPAVLTLITAIATPPLNPTARGGQGDLRLNTVNVNKGASLNVLLFKRGEAQQN